MQKMKMEANAVVSKKMQEKSEKSKYMKCEAQRHSFSYFSFMCTQTIHTKSDEKKNNVYLN